MSALLALLSLIGVGTTFFLWFRRIQEVRIPKDRTAFVVAALGSAALGAVAFASSSAWWVSAISIFAILGGGLFGVLVGISPQKTDGAIEVGDNLFEFIGDASALNDVGDTVSLSSYQGTPVLIKFFRGHW